MEISSACLECWQHIIYLIEAWLCRICISEYIVEAFCCLFHLTTKWHAYEHVVFYCYCCIAGWFHCELIISNALNHQTVFCRHLACSLTGVNLKAADRKIHANATDSYRLASKTVDIDTDLNFNVTVPAKYLNEVCHSIANQEEVTISIDPQKISFSFGDIVINTRLLDDEFPDTARLIPTSYQQRLKVSAREMINAIDRTLFIKSDGKNTIKMNINSDRIELTSTNQSVISSFEEIKVIDYEGNPLEISCSGKYLQDAIKAFDADEITIDFSGELRPMVVKKENDDSLIQLISPVRTYR